MAMAYPNLVGAVVVIAGLAVAVYIIPYLLSPLNRFPGPFWAQFTDWWRLRNTLDYHRLQIEQHKKHGAVVRWGPNCLSIGDPALVKTIYNSKGNFLKSDFYTINDVLQNGVLIQNIFGTKSNEFHRKYARPIQPLYNMKSILPLEPLADKTTALFCRRLEEEFVDGNNAGRVCNFSDWISFYAWDVDGEITFDQPFGFLEAGKDIDNWMHTSEAALKYFAVVGQIPVLDRWLAKNPYVRLGGVGLDWAANYCARRLFARYEEIAQVEKEGKGQGKSRVDFLDYFINLKKEHPDVVDDFTVISFMVLNVLAGADTTAVTLRAVMYFLLKNPTAYNKLVAEIDAAQLPDPVPYSRSTALQYLDAVIKESMRLYPAVAMMLERVVPSEGLELRDGRVIPPGTVVGMNPWVISRDAETYGEDVEAFRPERWLQGSGETDAEYTRRLQTMKAADLSFGAGNRSCIGRNMALVEMYKIIPTLLKKYKWELADPDEEWKVECKWLAFQGPINVKLARR